MGHTLTAMYPSEAKRRTTPVRGMVVTEASDAEYLDAGARDAILRRTIAAEIRDDGAIMMHLAGGGWALYEKAGYQPARDAVETIEPSGA